MPWFYHPFQELTDEILELEGQEVRHILGARRLHVGDQLVLMNGAGKLAHCVLRSANKKANSLTLHISLVALIEPIAQKVVLASAIPKGDRLSSMLDMATQMGIGCFQPIQFERSVSHWNAKSKARCERTAIEACKQSKSAWAPKIAEQITLKALLEQHTVSQNCIVLADQFGRGMQSHAEALESAHQIILLIGPEGGLTQQEQQLSSEHTALSVRLSDTILRIETAAIASLAALNQIGQ